MHMTISTHLHVVPYLSMFNEVNKRLIVSICGPPCMLAFIAQATTAVGLIASCVQTARPVMAECTQGILELRKNTFEYCHPVISISLRCCTVLQWDKACSVECGSSRSWFTRIGVFLRRYIPQTSFTFLPPVMALTYMFWPLPVTPTWVTFRRSLNVLRCTVFVLQFSQDIHVRTDGRTYRRGVTRNAASYGRAA